MTTLRKMYGEAFLAMGAVKVESRSARYEVYAKRVKLTDGTPSVAYYFVGASGAIRRSLGLQKASISRSMSDEWKARLLREGRAKHAETILENF